MILLILNLKLTRPLML